MKMPITTPMIDKTITSGSQFVITKSKKSWNSPANELIRFVSIAKAVVVDILFAFD